jgi:hypothetical protein
MDTTVAKLSPVDLVDSLDPERIRAELDELGRRERALKQLLRVALARQTGPVGRRGRCQADTTEGT